jgi:CheY-like chemotaxis protein
MQVDGPTALLVEDEFLIQCVAEDSLSDAGLSPTVVTSAEEALGLLQFDPQYRVLITDIDLGRLRMDGWELARLAREMRPDFPVVYVTGREAERWSSMGVPQSILVMKPFTPAQLVEAVRRLLIPGPAVARPAEG